MLDALLDPRTLYAVPTLDAMRADLEAALKGGYRAGYDRLVNFMTADRPNASDTPTRPIPTCGNPAAITALPQPAKIVAAAKRLLGR